MSTTWRVCDDCKLKPSTHAFGMGAQRCALCAGVFQRAWQDKRAKQEAERMEHHLASNHEDGYWCTECCLHEEHDHGVCADCGEDRTEHFAGVAESAFEGER